MHARLFTFHGEASFFVACVIFRRNYPLKAHLPCELLSQFHPSCRAGLERWLHDAYDVGNPGLADLAPARVRMLREYPALAVAASHGYDLGPATAMFCFGQYPMAENAKRSRLRIGPDVPASALRIKTGRGGWAASARRNLNGSTSGEPPIVLIAFIAVSYAATIGLVMVGFGLVALETGAV